YHFVSPQVKKIPFSINCIHVPYDITRPQPQLFVTPNFPSLTVVLEQLADTMAYRIGGLEALEKAQRARTVTTTVLNTGLQISGRLAEIMTDSAGKACYLRYQGPVQLAYDDAE